ncbi:ATP-binding protein [Candidatus Parcubacteria bacterium]|nr:ATP-binding protein [Candidatus Parcubacteria bacterium]
MISNILLLILIVISVALSCWARVEEDKFRRLREEKTRKESELERRLYELSILQEVSDRIGYSLNVEKLAQIITGSLGRLLEYSTVSYLLVGTEKVVFHCQVEESVSLEFVKDVKQRMRDSFEALQPGTLSSLSQDEAILGNVLSEENEAPVRSFFNIPLVVAEKPVGILTVASTKAGLYREEEMTILYKIVERSTAAVSRLQTILRTEKGKLEAIVQSLADGIITVDSDLRLLIINPRALNILNLQDKESVNILDVIDATHQKFSLRQAFEEAILTKKEVISNEITLDDHVYQSLVSPVLLEDQVLGAVCLLHDLTRERELEKLRQDFTSMIVHDLRGPLTVLVGTADTLTRHHTKLGQAKMKKLLTQMKESAQGMIGEVSELLDVARMEEGKFEIKKRVFNLRELLLEKAKFFTPLAESKGLELQTKLPQRLAKVNGDREQLNRVLDNLLGNAIKFTAKGTVTLGARGGKKGIEVFVQDTGSGIGAEEQTRLFTKFGKLKGSGSGLGLAIAKGIVEAHRGKIWVESREGRGSKFTFTLPRTL